MLQGNRGVERIADRVREPAVALKALRKFRRALRMYEQHGTELFGFGPNGMEFGIGKILSQYASADRGSAQALFLDRRLQLLHSELWKLQGERSESPKALRPGCTELRQLLVLNLDDRSGGVAVLAVPERIYGEYLHVDRHRVHFLQTLFMTMKCSGSPFTGGSTLSAASPIS